MTWEKCDQTGRGQEACGYSVGRYCVYVSLFLQVIHHQAWWIACASTVMRGWRQAPVVGVVPPYMPALTQETHDQACEKQASACLPPGIWE
jgi:hypothetical protein